MEPSKKQETVVVQDYPKKMGYVQAQPYTHFRLKHKSDRKKLLDAIQQASTMGPIVASYDYGRKYDTDIIIRKQGDSNSAKPIGKIHLLLFDRRDRYRLEKYYIKLHFFQFANDALFDKVKEAVSNFFNTLEPTTESYWKNSTQKNNSAVKMATPHVSTRKNRGSIQMETSTSTQPTKFDTTMQS
jgi:hypothetical protein